MRRYEILAPAKINLTLHVLDRRDDGFHDLASLLVPISLADRLEVAVGGEGIRVRVPGQPELEGPDNLCAKAARAFAARTGLSGAATVVLHKEVPIAAGLGGGSSDAAAVLRCLADAHGLDVDLPAVREAALEVGSDVPFFLRCTPALARGRGERLEPAPELPPLFLLVLKPPFGISAGDAYRKLAELRAAGDLPRGRERPLPTAFHDPSVVFGLLENDLEAAVAAAWPVAEPKRRLLAAGAPAALLSGSGSCVFALFDSASSRDKCSKSIELLPGERLFAGQTLQAAPTLRETRGATHPHGSTGE